MAWNGSGSAVGGCRARCAVLVLSGIVLASPWTMALSRAPSTGAVAPGEPAAELFRPGVCPPFPLRTERGEIIDPIAGHHADQPYSPRQTCGGCHDYAKITEGFHFTQGKGEPPTAEMAARCAWVTSPGNYGGTW